MNGAYRRKMVPFRHQNVAVHGHNLFLQRRLVTETNAGNITNLVQDPSA